MSFNSMKFPITLYMVYCDKRSCRNDFCVKTDIMGYTIEIFNCRILWRPLNGDTVSPWKCQNVDEAVNIAVEFGWQRVNRDRILCPRHRGDTGASDVQPTRDARLRFQACITVPLDQYERMEDDLNYQPRAREIWQDGWENGQQYAEDTAAGRPTTAKTLKDNPYLERGGANRTGNHNFDLRERK